MLRGTDDYVLEGRSAPAVLFRPDLRLLARRLGYGAFLILGAILLTDVVVGGGALQWLRDGDAAQHGWVTAHEGSYGRGGVPVSAP